MYFTYENKKFCINCDWLQYAVQTHESEPELFCPDGYRLEICQGNNIFRNRAMVFDGGGRKVITLLWSPYSKVLNQQIMTVQVANEFLYEHFIEESFSLVNKIVPCSFNNIGRVDICCDFEINQESLLFIKHLNSGHYYVERKREGSTFWHETNENGFKHKQLHCLSWGSKTSEIKVKLYNKSREQGLIGGTSSQQDMEGEEKEMDPEKPWIVNEWKEAGMDIKSVWRLEFSLSGAGQLMWNKKHISLSNVASWSWLMRVFFDMFHERFITRVNQGNRSGHKNMDKRVYLMSLPTDGEQLKWKESEQKEKISKPAIELLRSMMNGLENQALLASKALFVPYASTIIDIVERSGLQLYFKNCFEKDVNTYFEDMFKDVGSGMVNRIASPKRLMN